MVHGDRVQETTSTTGTGSLTLAGATEGHQSFADEIGEGLECVYLIELASDPSVWEISKGALTGTTLTRTLIKSSTGSLIDWAAGTKHVSQVLDAGTLNEFGAVTAPLVLDSGTITASEPILDLSQTWNNSGVTFEGVKLNVTDTASAWVSELMGLQVGGVSQLSVRKNGNIIIPSSASLDTGSMAFGSSSVSVRMRSSGIIQWTDGALASTVETTIGRLFTGGLDIYQSTSAKTLNIYNTYSNTSNYERFAISWDSNTLRLRTQAAGTGTQRNLSISAGTAQILMPDLPTSDPAVAGALWRSGNDLKISTG